MRSATLVKRCDPDRDDDDWLPDPLDMLAALPPSVFESRISALHRVEYPKMGKTLESGSSLSIIGIIPGGMP